MTKIKLKDTTFSGNTKNTGIGVGGIEAFAHTNKP